jgi:hypothetical protein
LGGGNPAPTLVFYGNLDFPIKRLTLN